MQPSQHTNSFTNHVPSPESTKPHRRGRLLVVEDAKCTQQILCSMIHKMGMEAKVAGNGQIACEMAEESKAEGKPYDLVLMDIRMPVMNGYEATRWLRSQGWLVPIVAVTAYNTNEDREKCMEAGCDDYLSKPVHETALRNVVARYLGEIRPDDTNAHASPAHLKTPAPKANSPENVWDSVGAGCSIDLHSEADGALEFEFL
jgi:CheY-like chemotaxis protein